MYTEEEFNSPGGFARMKGTNRMPMESAVPGQERGVVEEIGKSVAYGAVEAVRSISNLFTPESLDWENPIDKPQTWYGGLIGGFTQFAIPYAGLGKIATLGAKGLTAAGKAGKTTGFLEWFGGKGATRFVMQARTAAEQGNTVKALGLTLADATARGTIRGAFVDLIGFSGQDENLSNMLQAYPQLANPVSEILAIDADDSEIVGRLKNVAEGVILGVALDSLITSVKVARAYRKALDVDGLDERGATEVALDTAKESIQETRAAREAAETAEFEAIADEVVEPTVRPSLVPPEVPEAAVEPTVRPTEVPEEVAEAVTPEAPTQPSVPTELQPKTQAELQADLERVGNIIRYVEDLRDLQGETGKTVYVNEALEDLERLGIDVSHADDAARGLPEAQYGNPEKMTALELAELALEREYTNYTYYVKDADSAVRAMNRALERSKGATQPLPGTARSNAKFAQNATRILKQMGNFSDKDIIGVMAVLGDDAAELERISTTLRSYELLSAIVARDLNADMLRTRDVLGVNATMEDFIAVGHKAKMLLGLKQGVDRVVGGFGRGLQRRQVGLDVSEKALKALETEVTYNPIESLVNLSADNFDPKRARELLDSIQKLIASGDPLRDAKALAEFNEYSMLKKTVVLAQEWHINALLSGPSTQVVNAISGAMMTFWRPLERMMGGALMSVEGSVTGNKELTSMANKLIGKEARRVAALMAEFRESWEAVKQSGGNIFSMGTKREGARFSAIRAMAEQSDRSSLFTPIAKGITLPSAMLEKTDEFFKTWNGRAYARVELMEKMAENTPDILQVGERVDKMLNAMMKRKGTLRMEAEMVQRIRQENIPGITPGLIGEGGDLAAFNDGELNAMVSAADRGFEAGTDATFQTKMTRETAFERLTTIASQAVTDVPALKYFVPFINTPANIARYGWDRTLGGALGGAAEAARKVSGLVGMPMPRTEKSLLKVSRMLQSGDPEQMAQARFSMALGIGLAGNVLMLASQRDTEDNGELPRITGSGPSNPDALRVLKEQGWQPFSFRIGGKYVSYARLDPFASILGVFVDASEYSMEANDPYKADLFQAVTMGLTVGVINNMASKTYMQGLANVIDLVSDPDANGERVLGATAASFVPTIVSKVEQVIDPDVAEVRSVMDRVMSRIPGLSSTLPVRRDLLGEPVSVDAPLFEMFAPMRVTSVKDSVVRKEIARFSYGFSEPATTKSGVDLLDPKFESGGQLAYDRFLELTGKVRVSNMDLRQALRKEFSSAGYQRLDPGENLEGDKSPRIDRINGILRRYRAQAWRELLQERPSIRSEMNTRSQEAARRKRGILGI